MCVCTEGKVCDGFPAGKQKGLTSFLALARVARAEEKATMEVIASSGRRVENRKVTFCSCRAFLFSDSSKFTRDLGKWLLLSRRSSKYLSMYLKKILK